MVDYNRMFAELQQRGIYLTDDEKRRCEAICGDRLRNHDGGQVINNSFGGTLQGLMYTLFAVVKNLFGAMTNGGGSLGDMFANAGGMASNFGSIVSRSADQGKLYQLQTADCEIYDRLQGQGGNLARAAEYITGVKPAGDNSPDQILPSSIANQVGASINLPVNFDTSLNVQPLTGLPNRTRPLTGRG